MPDNNAPIERPVVTREGERPAPPNEQTRAAIIDLMALILIVIGIVVATVGVYIVLGIGFALIVIGVASSGLGIALGYR